MIPAVHDCPVDGGRTAKGPPPFTRRTMAVAPATAFVLTAAALTAVQLASPHPLLLAERFLPGAGWVEALLLSAWAALVARKLLDPRTAPRWRLRIWTLFSVVFFAQLLLGLAGADQFLMTGRLHLPIPALIVAGPIYRGEGLFMPILFLATVLLVGPAWCSHLCYMGAWDGLAASHRKRPLPAGPHRRRIQLAVAALVVVVAAALRLAGADRGIATAFAAAFGVAGVGVMLLWSRRQGRMVHCTTWCPIGLLATTLGRLSPFRLRIARGCTDCGACLPSCRYDALSADDVRRGRPGPACTLCGDCVRPCPRSLVQYRFPGLSPTAARTLFLVLVASIHALFLGVARI